MPLMFLLSALLIVTPWTIRNYLVSGKLIPVAVSGIGTVMFLGTCENNNNWQSFIELPSNVYDSIEEKSKAQSLYNNFIGEVRSGSMKALELDNALMQLAIQRIQKHPFECFKRWFLKIPRLWYQFYVPIYYYNEASGGFFIFYFIFAVIALLESSKNERLLMIPICLLFIYLNLVFLPLHIEPRYSVPLMPCIISLTAIGIWKAITNRYTAFCSNSNSKT